MPVERHNVCFARAVEGREDPEVDVLRDRTSIPYSRYTFQGWTFVWQFSILDPLDVIKFHEHIHDIPLGAHLRRSSFSADGVAEGM